MKKKELKKELDKLRFYISEKERLIKEVEELSCYIKDGYKITNYNHFGRNGRISSDGVLNLALNNIKYENLIKKRIDKLGNIIKSMYKLIEKIDNPRIKQIVELRAIQGKKWEEIGEIVGYSYSNCVKIYKEFIEE